MSLKFAIFTQRQTLFRTHRATRPMAMAYGFVHAAGKNKQKALNVSPPGGARNSSITKLKVERA